jgi:tubulin polyglutamylase TTLL6/13
MRMAKHFPSEYDFFPKTWILPISINELRTYCAKNNKLKTTYIVKPDSLC